MFHDGNKKIRWADRTGVNAPTFCPLNSAGSSNDSRGDFAAGGPKDMGQKLATKWIFHGE